MDKIPQNTTSINNDAYLLPFNNSKKSSVNYFSDYFKIEYSKEYLSSKMPLITNIHFHDYYETFFLLSGELFYFVKDKKYHIKPWDFVLINSYDIHYYESVQKDQHYERFLINIKKEFLTKIQNEYLLDDIFSPFENNICVLHMNHAEQYIMKNLISLIKDETRTPKKGQHLYLETLLIQLLILVLRKSEQFSPNDSEARNETHNTVTKVIQYINENYNEEITLSSVSERFFISPYYFSRLFKKNTGFSFTEYINNTRIKEAQILLQNGNTPISDIAEAVGYKSITHFGRVFKNITGISPLSFRKNNTHT